MSLNCPDVHRAIAQQHLVADLPGPRLGVTQAANDEIHSEEDLNHPTRRLENWLIEFGQEPH
jgi:hypothetical protein